MAEDAAGQLGRARRVAARAARTRDAVLASRDRYRPVDVALSLAEHDLQVGGSLMAGALAFRLFLWTLPAGLLTVGLLGFHESSAGSAASAGGLGQFTASTIEQAAEQAHRSRWAAVLLGGVLILSVSIALAKALRVATALTWREPVRKFPRPLRAALVTIGMLGAVLVMIFVAGWLRSRAPGLGLSVTLLLVLVWAAQWWAISRWLLPHRPALPWWGLLPGAALVGIGAQIMHLVIIYYLSPKISSSSALYGSLGAAATLLLGIYLIARLILAATALNATVVAVYAAGPSSASTRD